MLSPDSPGTPFSFPTLADYPRGKLYFVRFEPKSKIEDFLLNGHNYIAQQLRLLFGWWFLIAHSCSCNFLKVKNPLLPFVVLSHSWIESLLKFLFRNRNSKLTYSFYNYFFAIS
jgi:hypothetical protein